MRNLLQYQKTLNKLVTYYKAKNYGDFAIFVKLPFINQLGVYLEFLDHCGIGIHFDRYCHVIFYLYPELQLKKLPAIYNKTKNFNIKEVYLEIPNNLFTNAANAIEDAFQYLENPF